MSRVLRERTALLPILLVGAIMVLAYPLLAVTDAAAEPSPESDEPEHVTDEPPGERPIIFAHRGASGYRPEHTIESYKFAIQMDVDSVEPDLVSTEDGHLVARHENWIGETTDVAERSEFADRQTTKTVSGTEVEDEWFTEDFTLEELKTLRGVEPVPDIRQHNTIYDGRFEIATLQEIIDLVEEANQERPEHDQIGIFPETKHPTYFESIGLGLEEPLAEVIKENDLNQPGSGIMLQSFEPTSLQKLDDLLDVPKAQAITTSGAPYDTIAKGEGPTFEDMITPDGLEEIATYAEWIGPHKNLVIPREDDDSLSEPSPLVDDAHDVGLEVAAYTFRNENNYLPTDLQVGDDPSHYGDAIGEYVAYFEAGVDGVWSDNPDTAMIARDDFRESSDLTVEPTSTEVEVGDVAQLTGTVVYEDGSEQDVTEEAEWSSDDSEVASVDAGLVTGIAEGEATVTVSFHGLSAHSTVTVTEDEVDDQALERIAAPPGRVEVAIAASQHRFDDAEAGAVVLARADEYPDALAGTTLAADHDAPLLLTSSDVLLDNVADEISRVLGDDGSVYLTGGTEALDETVEDAVEGLEYQTTRLGGETRFETAGVIADALGERSQVLVTTGLDFPDALTAGAAASANDGVVLLSADDDAHDVVNEYLAGFDGEVTAVGGPATRAYPDAEPVMGETRDETAVAVAEAFFDEPVAFGISRRDDYPDALSGGAHIAAYGGPLLLSYTEDVPEETADWLQATDATGGFVYGGTAAIDEDTFNQIEDLTFNNGDEES